MSTVRTSRTVIEYTGSPLASFSLAWLRSRGVAVVAHVVWSPDRLGCRQPNSVGKCLRLVVEPVDGLDLEVLLEPESAHRATDAGLLVSAHGGVGIRGGAVVADPSGTQAVHHPAGVRPVATEDEATEPVGRVVGDPQGIVLVAVGHDGQDGAEDLLAGDRHLRGHVGEHRGLHEVAAVQPFGPLEPPGDEVGRPRREPLWMSSLTDLNWAALTTGPMVVELSSGSPRRKRLRLVDEEGHHLLQLALVHQHPGGGMAGLAGVEEGALDVPARGLLEVGVGQHDVGRLPAQFEADALDGAGGGGTHLSGRRWWNR